MTGIKPVPSIAEFSKPPVIETALAIEFAPIPGWTTLHYGALWEEFRTEYPLTEVYPVAGLVQATPTDPPLRYFFLNRNKTELVQMRAGAFVKNWRATPENDNYPRYSRTRLSFERDLKTFLRFLDANSFPVPDVWKCEVTYVNHFIRGKEWADFSEVGALIPALSPLATRGPLNHLSQLQALLTYQLPDDFGALQIQLMPALRADGKELLQLTLTAYGKPKSNDMGDLLGWLDEGRKVIVRGFSDFTSPAAQSKYWGRTS